VCGRAQAATVRRVDPGLGLLVELRAQAPADPDPADPAARPADDDEPAEPAPAPLLREKGDKRRGGRKKAARAAKRAAVAAAGGAGAASGGGGGGGGGAAATGYAHISNVADTRVERLDKARRAATGNAQGSGAC